MSFMALSAIRGVDPPSPTALLLLFLLAEYAGPDGRCYPSQALLMERSTLGERAVRDNLHLLIEAGLITVRRRVRKNGSRTSDEITLLYYTPEQSEQAVAEGDRLARQPAKSAGGENGAGPDAARDGGEKDNRRNSPVGNRRLTPDLPADSAGPTTFEPVSEYITQDACASAARLAFDRVGEAWMRADPDRFARPKAWAAWLAAVEGGEGGEAGAAGADGASPIDPDQLAEAALRFLAESGQIRRQRCPMLHTWLADRRFEGWLGKAAPPAVAAPTGWAGPPEIRAALVARCGEGFAASYLDQARWRADDRRILPRTTIAADALRNAARAAAWAGLDVTIGEVERARSV